LLILSNKSIDRYQNILSILQYKKVSLITTMHNINLKTKF